VMPISGDSYAKALAKGRVQLQVYSCFPLVLFERKGARILSCFSGIMTGKCDMTRRFRRYDARGCCPVRSSGLVQGPKEESPP
jgi:hypothetical protein